MPCQRQVHVLPFSSIYTWSCDQAEVELITLNTNTTIVTHYKQVSVTGVAMRIRKFQKQ